VLLEDGSFGRAAVPSGASNLELEQTALARGRQSEREEVATGPRNGFGRVHEERAVGPYSRL